MNFFKNKIYKNLVLLTLVAPLFQGCDNYMTGETSTGGASTEASQNKPADSNVSGQSASSACATISYKQPFNGGKGTVDDPYVICSPQQFLNISSVTLNEKLPITAAGYFEFPYMDKAFILGADIRFVDSGVEFFSIGHLMASVGRSTSLPDSKKQMIATYDELNSSTFVASLASMRIPFNGQLDGKGYGIEIGEYYPTESRMVGLFGMGAPGIVLKNLIIKNFKMFNYGGVNTGLLLGSLLESGIAKQWANYSGVRSKKPSLIENITIANSSIMNAVANSGALVGAVRVYPEQSLIIKEITIDSVKIDGGLITQLEPQYGDDITTPIYNKMHNVGGLVGLLHSEGEIEVEDIVVKSGSIAVEDFYTGKDQVKDISDTSFIQTFDPTDYLSYDINFIYDLMDTPDYSGNDPAWGISNVIGSLGTLTDDSSITINRVKVQNSSSVFYEAAKGVGGFAGEIAMLSGSLEIRDINLSTNTISMNNNDVSTASWAVGSFAGAATLGGSNGKYHFENISVNGKVTATYAAYSSDVSGFIGHVGAIDEVMDADNLVDFQNILITGSSSVAGSDVRSMGPFAGSVLGLGDLSGKSTGSNIFNMNNILNQFQVITPGTDPMLIGGFIGFLDSGEYTITNVVVDSDLTVIDPSKLYDRIGQVIGYSNAKPKVANSFYVLKREELVSGLGDKKNDFAAVKSLKDIDFVASLSKGFW